MIRIGLADDDEEVCRQQRRVFDVAPDLEVVGHAHYAAEALDLVARTAPDVLLLDVRMPGGEGTGIVPALLAFPDPPAVVMVTNFPTPGAALASIENGASGFLVKATPPEELRTLVRLVAAGYQVFDRSVRAALNPLDGSRGREAVALTPRERDVLDGLRDGLSNGRIASRLGISEPTVKGHVSALMTKLGCSSRLQVALSATPTT